MTISRRAQVAADSAGRCRAPGSSCSGRSGSSTRSRSRMVMPGATTRKASVNRLSCGLAALVEHLPGDEHRHDDRLAAAGRHLAGDAEQVGPGLGRSSLREYFSIQSCPYFVCLATSVMKMSVSSGLDLAEEQRAPAVARASPVLEQRRVVGVTSGHAQPCRHVLNQPPDSVDVPALGLLLSKASNRPGDAACLLRRAGDRQEVAAAAPPSSTGR